MMGNPVALRIDSTRSIKQSKPAPLLIDRCLYFKPLDAVDVNIKQSGNIEFGLHALRGSGIGMQQPQVQILAHFILIGVPS